MRILLSASLVALLSACSSSDVDTTASSTQFDETRLRQDIQELASDRYQGRMPTTEGEKLTLGYLVKQFKQMGLAPGNGDSYLQEVPMQRFATTSASLVLAGRPLPYRKQMVLNSFRNQSELTLNNSEIVFVGYGINAPEHNWNDYQGLDVAGKTVVILVNDPGFASNDPDLFKGKTMTYYGRWDYKFAEAGRQGAAAALIVHDTKPASYPWSVVQNSWTGPKLDLAGSNDPHPDLEGWITLDSAKQLFNDGGYSFSELTAQAQQQPTAQALGVAANAQLKQQFEQSRSFNVIATLEGEGNNDEHILYTAHWDHIGSQLGKIYNGAMDNASGLAAMLEIARGFSDQPAPNRSVSFVAVTGEEQGLLGSRYYAANPIYPLDKTVGVFNIDSTNVYGKTRDYRIVGLGQSQLEQFLADAVEDQGRELKPESNPSAGGFFRSDHFSFANKGVPAVFAGGGSVPWDEATAEYKKAMQETMKGCYHNPCDIYRSEWDLSGTLMDMRIYFEAGRNLANSQQWPGYYPSSEFHSMRPATQG